MHQLLFAAPIVLASLLFATTLAEARTPQDPPPAEPGPALVKVFLDCPRQGFIEICDFEFLRQEIQYLDYVNDRNAADVHVLVTTENTSSGGRRYDIQYLGLGRFSDQKRTSMFVTSGTDTADERRRGFARVFSLGLVPYLLQTTTADALRLAYQMPVTGRRPQATTRADDPWNFWIFRISANGELQGERSDSRTQFRTNLSANRTTQAWKISFAADGQFNQNEFTLSSGARLTSKTSNWNVRNVLVKSVTRDHWAVATRVQLSANTQTNHDRNFRFGGGMEYSVFSYDESSRREWVFQYTVGTNHFKYRERTLLNKTEETVADQVFLTRLAMRQPWGSTTLSFEAANYLHDLSRHRLQLEGRMDVRLFRGFSLNVNGNASRVRDQLYLPAGRATDEEILLRLRRLETSYRYQINVGFSYQFGSIFNNTVNPRFDGR